MMHEDWNQRYIDSNTPWDSGVPSEHLKSLLNEGLISPCRMLEIGCGTGTNAIYLARAGFDVTAVDIAEEAIKRATEKAAQCGVNVKFIHSDLTALPDLGPPFEFVFDRGTYHIVRRINLPGFQSTLARVVATGGYFAVLAGNSNEDAPLEKGPPRVSASELCAEVEGSAFDLVRLIETKFHGVRIDGEDVEPLAWYALFRRRGINRSDK